MTDTPLEPEATDPATAHDLPADDPAAATSGADPGHHRGPSGDWASRPNADAHRDGVAVDSAHWTPGHEGDRSTGAISTADWVGGRDGVVPSHWAEGSDAGSDDDVDDGSAIGAESASDAGSASGVGDRSHSEAGNLPSAEDTTGEDPEPSR